MSSWDGSLCLELNGRMVLPHGFSVLGRVADAMEFGRSWADCGSFGCNSLLSDILGSLSFLVGRKACIAIFNSDLPAVGWLGGKGGRSSVKIEQ